MRKWFTRSCQAQSRHKIRREPRVLLKLEQLEDRLAPAVITVTGTVDTIAIDGLATLREAITSINNQADVNGDVTLNRVGGYASTLGGTPDVINFSIPGAGVQTISLGSSLPAILKPVNINGYTQSGTSANTLANSDNAVILIQIDGASAGTAVNGLTLGAGSAGSTIKGLDITNFRADANFNGGVGILVQSNGNSIVGNFVGTNAAGTTQMSNGGDGIRVLDASNNLIGTTNAADRNVVSGNVLDGIHVEGTVATPATGNLIQGNFVGVAANGVSNVGLRTVAVPSAGAVGTSSGNFLYGIEVSGGNNNTVGGVTSGARNVVGFNTDGIEIDNGGQSNLIQGNFVGVGSDGITQTMNVAHGIALHSSAGLAFPTGPGQANEPGVSFNVVGGTSAGAGNLVEFNGAGGIVVFGHPVSTSGQPNVGNAIEGNSVFENGRSSSSTPELGIDLSNSFPFPQDDGVTANDSAGHGAANDPNNFQNFPVLTSAVSSGGTTTITGTLKSTASLTYRIEFFASDADPLGLPSEGQQFLGSTSVTTDASGNASFSVALSVSVANGRVVTATATDSTGNTSEFSAGLTLPAPLPTPAPPTPTPTPTPPPAPVSIQIPPYVSVAVGPVGGVLELVNSSGTLTQFDASGAHVISGGIRSASVSFDPRGNEVLLITYQSGALVLFDSGGAHIFTMGGVLSASVTFGSIGEVFEIVTLDGTLSQYDSSGAHVLSGGVVSASVAFGPAGEVLDVVYGNGVLIQFDATGGHSLGGGVRSAGVAFSSGSEIVDVLYLDGSLFQFDSTGTHSFGKVA